MVDHRQHQHQVELSARPVEKGWALLVSPAYRGIPTAPPLQILLVRQYGGPPGPRAASWPPSRPGGRLRTGRSAVPATWESSPAPTRAASAVAALPASGKAARAPIHPDGR